MKKIYKEPSIEVVQVQSTSAFLQASLTGQQGNSNPSVIISDGPFEGSAASKSEVLGPVLWE